MDMLATAASILGLIAAASLQTSAQSETLNQLEAQLSQQDASLREISRETISLHAQRIEIDRSLELRREEAQSLRTRFPRLTVSDTFNTQQFVSELQAEEQRLRQDKADTLYAILLVRNEQVCTSLRDIEQTAGRVQQSPDWARMTLEERSAVRAAVVQAREQAYSNGDPCKPAARPSMSSSMIDD
ncbi:hypothetical protein SAQ01S_02690 [Sphingomonas aquatilis NBRC 16722]|uniref:Uncharacterized protein n=1 Tax=Sphingomonas aquatilis TaxID=93063 RepID=A0AAW3TNK2_9SPHN|nr:hypothetical protein [Sphingomonas aquatilis]MBB3874266.1 hypothetical protein [Sphingomonas aquatilis]GEM70503.1 hypothetical protein SAQ01S_02690 [Sphingomonas aquatilis NBRC 16722]